MECSLPLIRPMLAVRTEPFNSEDFIFEVKWDGYRCLAYLYKNRTELRSRNQKEISSVFPELSQLHLSVKSCPMILDGEVVVFSGQKPSFAALQSRGRLTDPQKVQGAALHLPTVFIVFDILYAEGQWLLELPLIKRKEKIVKSITPGPFLAVSEFVSGKGVLFSQAVRERGLEGVVAKEVNSPYLPGKRSGFWKKIRHINDAELIIGAYTLGKGARKLGALLLCSCNNGELSYCGRVGTGFSQETEEELLCRLGPLIINKPEIRVPMEQTQGVIWVKPRLVCTVTYLEKTKEGYLRHPSFKGLRFDKEIQDCWLS